MFREVLSHGYCYIGSYLGVLIPSCSGKFYHLARMLIPGIQEVLIPSCSGKFYHTTKVVNNEKTQVLIPSCSGKFYHEVMSDDIAEYRGLNPFVFREVLSPSMLLRCRVTNYVLIPSCSGKFYHAGAGKITLDPWVLIPSCSGKFYHDVNAVDKWGNTVLIPSCSGKFYHADALQYLCLGVSVLIPSCSGKFYHITGAWIETNTLCLNPFVFREVLSHEGSVYKTTLESLNPFVFREVLSPETQTREGGNNPVLIPSCSGKFYHTNQLVHPKSL